MLRRIRQLHDTMMEIVYKNVVQLHGLRTHHAILTCCGPEKYIWIIYGIFDDMERELLTLERQYRSRPITHHEVWIFFERANVKFIRLTEADARKTGLPFDFAKIATVTADSFVFRSEYMYDDEQGRGPASYSFSMLGSTNTQLPIPSFALSQQEIWDLVWSQDTSAATKHLIKVCDALGSSLDARECDAKVLSAAIVDCLATIPQICDACGKTALHVCGKCHIVRYCTAACQRAAWPQHKRTCPLLEKLGHILIVRVNCTS